MEKQTKNLSLFDFIEDDIDSDSDYEEYGIAKNADKVSSLPISIIIRVEVVFISTAIPPI